MQHSSSLTFDSEWVAIAREDDAGAPGGLWVAPWDSFVGMWHDWTEVGLDPLSGSRRKHRATHEDDFDSRRPRFQ